MLIICTIAYMIIYQNIRIQVMKDSSKCFGISAVVFNKISVQIKILGITPEAIAFRSILVYP